MTSQKVAKITINTSHEVERSENRKDSIYSVKSTIYTTAQDVERLESQKNRLFSRIVVHFEPIPPPPPAPPIFFVEKSWI